MTFAKTWQEAKAPMMARGAECERCPLREAGLGPVPSELNEGSKVIVIGPAPAKDEIESHRPMQGYIGRSVRKSVSVGGVRPHEVTYATASACGVPGGSMDDYLDKLPHGTNSPLDCCRPRLARDIAESGAGTIVTLGAIALEQVGKVYGVPVGGKKSKRGERRLAGLIAQRGHPFIFDNGKVLLATLLSARDQKEFTHIIDEDIRRGCAIAKRGHKVSWTAPKVLFDTVNEPLTVDRIEAVLGRIASVGVPVIEDIETNGLGLDCLIRCVGFAADLPGEGRVIIVVPLHHIGGSPYWSGRDLARVEAAIRNVNDTCELVFHNGAFDTERLLRRGLMSSRSKQFGDTAIMHHNTYENDLPHRLAFVSTRFSEAPMWKADMDHKADENEQRDEDLHYYCGLDNNETATAYYGLRQWIERDKTSRQNEIDHELAPIARNMGSLGHAIDLGVRDSIRTELGVGLTETESILKSIVGDKFNPRSPNQVRKYLFETKGHRPTIQTGPRAKEWTEGEDAATSMAALALLEDRGVDKETQAFITTLMKYRALEKLRSSYVDCLELAPSEWQEIGLLHPVFNVFVIPSGRWSCSSSPSVQTIPSRGRVNIKKMYRAVPGHVLVGADWSSLEVRVFTWITGDPKYQAEFQKNDPDPHSLSAAALFAKNPEEEVAEYERIKAGNKAGDKTCKFQRQTGKTVQFLCIAEGEQVLTERGLVPIEKILLSDRVWDGVEWVQHGGVVCKGEKEVISYQGLRATAGHKVWLDDGRTCELGEAASRQERLACAGIGRDPIRFVGDTRRGLYEGSISPRQSRMHRLWSGKRNRLQQSLHRQVDSMQTLRFVDRSRSQNSAMVAGSDASCAATLSESPKCGLVGLRRSRDRVSFQLDRRGGSLDCRQYSTLGQSRSVFGSSEQRWSLRAGKLGYGLASREHNESTEHKAACRVGISSRGVAVRGVRCAEEIVQREDAGGHSSRRSRSGEAKAQALEGHRSTTRVYDILNAGPRHRFTVSGVLVSNCVYGGEREKLGTTMRSNQDKATGVRPFKNVTDEQAAKWHSAYHALHPDVGSWHKEIDRRLRRDGFVSTRISGRRRYFPGGAASKKNAPPNHEVQGTAADMKNEAILRINELIPHRGWSRYSGSLTDVHDYLAVQVPESRAEEAAAIVRKAMYFEIDGMKFPADPVISRWYSDQ